MWKTAKKSSNNSILQEKPTITFSKVCPAIKFANSRTPKLIGLKMYDNSSIGTNNKAKPNEVLEGMNKDNIWNLCVWIHIMFIPIKIEKDKLNVTIRWLVVVKLYGINPIKLLNKTKVKTTEMKGKYFSPSLLILSNNNCDDASYSVSTNTCHVLGMKKKLVSFK